MLADCPLGESAFCINGAACWKAKKLRPVIDLSQELMTRCATNTQSDSRLSSSALVTASGPLCSGLRCAGGQRIAAPLPDASSEWALIVQR